MLVVVESEISGDIKDRLGEKFTEKEIALLVAGYKALVNFQNDDFHHNFDRLSKPMQREIDRLEDQVQKLIVG